jgi:hypothetical protein
MENGVDLDIFGSSIGLRFALDVPVDQKLALVTWN